MQTSIAYPHLNMKKDLLIVFGKMGVAFFKTVQAILLYRILQPIAFKVPDHWGVADVIYASSLFSCYGIRLLFSIPAKDIDL